MTKIVRNLLFLVTIIKIIIPNIIIFLISNTIKKLEDLLRPDPWTLASGVARLSFDDARKVRLGIWVLLGSIAHASYLSYMKCGVLHALWCG